MNYSAARCRVPRFFLYGEPPRRAADGFLHIETIADRSRLYGWRISPHSHAELDQLLLIESGAGEMRVEGQVRPFTAAALLTVPATSVHAFAFEPETVGYVATIAHSFLADLAAREPAFRALFSAARSIKLRDATGDRARLASAVSYAAASMHRETLREAPASRAAAEGYLLILLAGAVRALDQREPDLPAKRGPRSELVERFRKRVEAQLRSGWTLSRYACALGVSVGQLRSACLDVTGDPPMRLVHERVLLEAKRLLAFSSMTVAQAAYDLGFSDPGYFSRFFAERAGQSPSAFRRERGWGA